MSTMWSEMVAREQGESYKGVTEGGPRSGNGLLSTKTDLRTTSPSHRMGYVENGELT